MSKTQDPGLGERFLSESKRIINKDGSFNVRRVGSDTMIKSSYQFLRNTSWFIFILLVILTYFMVNALFALSYVLIGVENIRGLVPIDFWEDFLNAFYFSVQTFTTVGYGAMAPMGRATSMVAAVEALTGLLSFALATGLLYGRFSRPSAKLLFSEHALISPHKDHNALMFRVVNRRRNVLMELEAKVLVKLEEEEDGELKRKFYRLNLENDAIHFFPMNWTLVHPIGAGSPLLGLTSDDLKKKKAEVLILIKGFDDTFSQIVHARTSYTADEIYSGASFDRVFFDG